ncbi:MAG: patatin-like phospholipase family protein [Pseudomonadota bacterium]
MEPDPPDATAVSRRRFLTWAAATALLAGCERLPAPDEVRVGLALGGGGARGLAHLVAMETLDELGIRPHRIAGTSIGAVLGALYAAGHSGRAIREFANGLIIAEGDTWKEILFEKQTFKWLGFFDVDVIGGGLFDSEGFMEYLGGLLDVERFEQLKIPLQVVAADLWTGDQVVFDSGPLLPAIKASMAIPGIFEPVPHQGRHLVDGGIVNPLPHDLLVRDCDLVIAVDVTGDRAAAEGSPGYTEALFTSFHNMQKRILLQRLERQPPEIYLKPRIEGVRVLEFYEADAIYAQAAGMKKELKRALRHRLDL